jgi:hypothetical protein
MADLTFNADAVKDGNGTAITGGVKTYTDPNDSSRRGAVVALIMADGTILRPGQALAAASLPVVLTAAQVTALTPPAAITGFALDATLGTTNTQVGGLTETAPATDTASSGLNGRLQRIAQRLTSLIALLPASLGIKTAAGSLSVAPASDATFTVGLPTGASTAAKQPALGTAGTASTDVLTVQGIASMTPLAGNVTQFAGTAAAVNSGNKDNGTLRFVLATDQPNLTTPLNVSAAAAASELHTGQVGGTGGFVNATYTRPSDTTAYAALDTISNSTSSPSVLTFTNFGRVNAGTGFVTYARVLTSQTSCTARLRLHLYRITPTAINDNAGCTAPLYADEAKYVGFIDFPAMQTGGGSPTAAFAQRDDLNLPFKCDTSDRNLYGILETLDAFTPANAQTFSITLDGNLD